MTASAQPAPTVVRFLPASDGGLGWAMRDTLTMTWRNLTTMRRVPQVLVFSLIQPVIFVLMFRFVFGGAITIPGYSYVDYLMPGIFVQTVAFGAISTAIGLAEDKGKGLLERLRTLPMARSAVLGGRVVADTVRNVVIVVLILGIGLAWLFALIGLSVTNGEAAQAASFPLLAPLVFASNLFVDPDTMPTWLQGWAEHQPVSAAADATRAWMLGGPTTKKVLISLAWSFGLGLVLGPIAVRRYRRAL